MLIEHGHCLSVAVDADHNYEEHYIYQRVGDYVDLQEVGVRLVGKADGILLQLQVEEDGKSEECQIGQHAAHDNNAVDPPDSS